MVNINEIRECEASADKYNGILAVNRIPATIQFSPTTYSCLFSVEIYRDEGEYDRRRGLIIADRLSLDEMIDCVNNIVVGWKLARGEAVS